MRSINTFQWEAGQATVPLKGISFDNTLLVKLSRYALKVLIYLPYQFNRYLDSLDAAHETCRKQSRDTHITEQNDRHRHIPSRVWQRRSALITAMEDEQQVNRCADNSAGVTPVGEVQSAASASVVPGSSFNVMQVRSLPVWASNYSDMEMIEREL